jgi:hypothetical protein
MGGEDLIANMQPQTYSLTHGLGGEEGFKKAWEIFRCDSRPVIGNGNHGLALLYMGVDAERAIFPHGLARVHEQVQEDLLDLGFISFE